MTVIITKTLALVFLIQEAVRFLTAKDKRRTTPFSDTWGSCEVLSCDSGYHEDSGACVSTFRFTELSIEGEFGEDEAPQISWLAENIDEVDHYEVSIRTISGANDVLDWD